MGDLRLVQFGEKYDQRQANTLVDILENTFANISTIIASVRKAAYQLTYNITPVGNVGAGEDTLMSYTVLVNTLAKNGYNLDIKAWGTFGATANNKEIKVYFGSTVIYDTGAHAANTGTWEITANITRTGTATQQAICSIISSNTAIATSVSYTTPSETLSSSIVFKITGTATADNDIVQDGLLIRMFPQE